MFVTAAKLFLLGVFVISANCSDGGKLPKYFFDTTAVSKIKNKVKLKRNNKWEIVYNE